MRTMVVIGAACLAFIIGAGDVAAGPRARGRARMDRLVTESHDADRAARVLVRFRNGTSAALTNRMRKRGIRVSVLHRRTGTLAVALGPGELKRWALDPDVEAISIDARITSPLEPQSVTVNNSGPAASPTAADAQFLRRTLGLPASAEGGRGVGVAVIDSGIAPTSDLIDRIVAFYDFTAGGSPAAPSDAFGHGTHIAGLIAGSGASSYGAYAGIAPNVRLIGMKVLDGNGQGYTSHALDAIEFAIEHRAALGIDIINLSIGHPVLESPATDPLVQAVERAAAAGIVVVASAGNFGKKSGNGDEGYGGIASPGNAPSALTVGALDTADTASRRDDRVAAYSSRGPTWYDGQVKPDIVAPGHGLIATASPSSTLYLKPGAKHHEGGYLALNGTSMAAAVTSGVVALMVEANRADGGPQLTPNTVKMVLQYTALAVDRRDSAIPSQLEQGAGGLNGAAAVEVARAINPAEAVGQPWLETGVVAATLIDEIWEPWAQWVIWGDRLVWGEAINRHQPAWTALAAWGDEVKWGADLSIGSTSLVVDSMAMWSSDLVWGAGQIVTFDDDHIVWGNSFDDEHIVWGNSFDDDHIVWGNSSDDDPVVSAAAVPRRRRR